MVPWSVTMTWRGHTTECRFDSISWATDMPEGDYLHDAGRVTGSKGLVLWAPRGFRPRFLRSDVAETEEAGTVTVRRADLPAVMQIEARDLGGNSTRRALVLLPGAPPPAPQPGWWRGDTTWAELPGEFASLPGGRLRWNLRTESAPRGVDLQVGAVALRATRAADRWVATFAVPATAGARVARVPFADRPAGEPRSGEGGIVLGDRLAASDSLLLSDEGRRLYVPAGALFEDAFLFATRRPFSVSARGMAAIASSWRVEPSTLPLHRPVRVRLSIPPGESLDHLGLCRGGADGWSWLGGERDSAARTVTADTRALGNFQLFRDTTAPRVALGAPPRRAARKPYSRWALEASVTEEGSGVDARASWFEVDGARVPTEWDPEVGRLRWRPAVPPKAGKHQVSVIATDRAGNRSRADSTIRVAAAKP